MSGRRTITVKVIAEVDDDDDLASITQRIADATEHEVGAYGAHATLED